MRCWRDTVCHDSDCQLVDIACVASCTVDTTCGDGSACLENGGAMLCSPYCTGSRCSPNFDCVGDPRSILTRCLPVACSVQKSCSAPGAFCELFDHDCFPVSGSCGAGQTCPAYGAAMSPAACGDDGYCHVAVTPPPAVKSKDPLAAIAVTTPTAGQLFASQEDLHFTWSDTGAPTIALVFDLPPIDVEALDNARWGEAVASGNQANWANGHAIANQVWQSSPGTPPKHEPLYFVVEALSEGKLVALSAAVPFSVAGGWKQPFDACTREGEVPGDCENPTFPQACHRHRCEVLCASQRDCEAHAETQGLACALPVALGDDPRPNARLCE